MKLITAGLALILSLAVVTGPATAAPISETAAERIVAHTDRPEAERELDESRDPSRALIFMQVEPGDRALDMFTGQGYYAELLSHAVGPSGRVIAQNPLIPSRQDIKSQAIQNRGFGKRLSNTGSMNVDFMDMRLAPASIDTVLFHLVYHDLYFVSAKFGFPQTEPQRVLAELHRALRPGGMVTVIDHVGDGQNPRADVAATHRIRPDIVKRDFQMAGFTLVAEETWSDNPDDDHSQAVHTEALRGKTDRFAMRFAKAGDPNAMAADDEAEGGVPVHGDGQCDASKVGDMAGNTLTDDLREAALATSGAQTLRVYAVGQPVTKDYRLDRLNIVIDPDGGAIVNLVCG